MNDVITRFKAANPGSDVKITLLPSNNDQLAAQVQAAFASKKVPDAMMLYSGAYTTAYEGGLRRINDYVQNTPGMYDAMSLWEGACVNFDCKDGSGEIVGVPVDQYMFVLWYRKDLLEKAGITEPPKTMDEFYAACDKLNAAGITADGLRRPRRLHHVQHADHEPRVNPRTRRRAEARRRHDEVHGPEGRRRPQAHRGAQGPQVRPGGCVDA